jgi:hypothetical protein
VDIVQATCLLAIYFYLNCQISDGYRQAFSAVRLATALGLHQIDITRVGISTHLWVDPKEEQQQGQKIHAFWQTYMVDRYWSTVYNLQSALPEFCGLCERITTPLPETAETLDSVSKDTIYSLLPNFPYASSDSNSEGTPPSCFDSSTIQFPAIIAIININPQDIGCRSV